MICLAARWLSRFSARRIEARLQFHADQDIDELRRFRAELLGVQSSAIKPQRKSNSGRLEYRTWRCQHGILTLRTNDTQLRARLQAWIDRVHESWVDSVAAGA